MNTGGGVGGIAKQAKNFPTFYNVTTPLNYKIRIVTQNTERFLLGSLHREPFQSTKRGHYNLRENPVPKLFILVTKQRNGHLR